MSGLTHSMVSLTRTIGCARLQHVQRETGTCDGSARAGAGIVAGCIEAVSASQGRMTGLEVGMMGSIQVRDEEEDSARPVPDVIGTGVFWMSEKDRYSSSPFSNAAELEPEGRDVEGGVMA